MPTERLFYDGSCALCHRAVRFVVARDTRGDAFRYAPLASEAFREAAAGRDLPDSLVVETRDGRLLARSAAVIHVMSRLRGPWPALARLARVVPTPVLDALYELVARSRYRLFGREPSACPVIPAELTLPLRSLDPRGGRLEARLCARAAGPGRSRAPGRPRRREAARA